MISVLHSGRERWIKMQTHCRSDPALSQIASIASVKKRESSVPMAKVARHMTLCPLKYLTMSSESCGLAQAFLGRGNRKKEQTICWRTTNGHHYSCVSIKWRTEQFPTSSSRRRLASAENGPPFLISTQLPRHTGHNGNPFFSRRACCITGGNLVSLVRRHDSLHSLQHFALAC